MLEIIPLFACFSQSLEPTTLRQLSRIVPALLSMTGRVTMAGIARWNDQGGSYRTVQRFFSTPKERLPWGQLMWLLFRHHLFHPDEAYLIAGDETTVTKAGRQTYGLDRFFSSIYNKTVPGLSFFALSLIGVQEGLSHPMLIEQVVREKTGEQAPKAPKAPKAQDTACPKRPKGRPKGSKNKDKTQIEWTPELRRLERVGQKLLALIKGLFPVTYLLLDGHFGNNNVLQVVRQRLGLHLICKLRSDSRLYFAYTGPQKASGPRCRFGEKLDYRAIPEAYRVCDTQDKGIRTEVYQATLRHQCFAQPLNVVILVKTNLQSGAQAHAVLFSSDLELSWELLVDYYRLRFQIEFNFRDCKQFWGLEDFMNIAETPVTHAANLSFFMVNLSHCLLRDLRRSHPQAGVLDLKACWRGRRYAQATLKLLPQPPTAVLMEQIMQQVACYGAIHAQTS